MKLGDKIKNLREERGIPAQELASHLGVSPSTLSNWESNRRGIDIDNIVKIARYFHVSTDFLLGNYNEIDMVMERYSRLSKNNKDIINRLIESLDNKKE